MARKESDMFLPPEIKTIIPPENGWQESTWYLVEVAFNKNNPVHKALFFTGYLNGGITQENSIDFICGKTPGGYNSLVACNGGYDGPLTYKDAHYLKAVRVILKEEEW